PITPTFLDIIASALMTPLPLSTGRTLRRVDDATPAKAGVRISNVVKLINRLNRLEHLNHLLPFKPEHSLQDCPWLKRRA
ncbi:hypothetical protein ABTH81_22770, partial [Acinetobacter baumannii]